MRYILFINNDEALASGDDPDFAETKYEVGELLRSGYYEVEQIHAILETE